MTPEQKAKKAITSYLLKHKMRPYRLSVSKWEPGVVRLWGWPSMQGQGVLAAAYSENRWAKLELFAEEELGVRLRRS